MICETTFKIFSTYDDCCTTGTQQNSEKLYFYQILHLLMCIVCDMCYDQNLLMRQLYNIMLKYSTVVDVIVHIRHIQKTDLFGKNGKFSFHFKKFTPILLMYQIWVCAWCGIIKVVSKMLLGVHEEYSCSILKS